MTESNQQCDASNKDEVNMSAAPKEFVIRVKSDDGFMYVRKIGIDEEGRLRSSWPARSLPSFDDVLKLNSDDELPVNWSLSTVDNAFHFDDLTEATRVLNLWRSKYSELNLDFHLLTLIFKRR